MTHAALRVAYVNKRAPQAPWPCVHFKHFAAELNKVAPLKVDTIHSQVT